MAHHTPSMSKSRIAAAAALCVASTAWSQTAANPQELVITSPAPQQVSGFGDVPLSKAPFSGVNFDVQTLRDIGATRISDALRLDASVSDAYNSPAYWDQLSVRGYTLDNKYNYRREGLPISAETMIPMENKERIELFKGTSGIQAGTSAPGGLANYMVKRAPAGNNETIRSITASYGNGKSSSLALDLGARFGESKDFGYRFNAAHEDLNPTIRNAQGQRRLVALAMDWRITPDSKLEWEFEHSERQQIGVNGYSLLGNTLPAPVNGKRNLTWQDWALPGIFHAHTGSIRFKQNLANGWLWTTSYGMQRLKTDDRLVFGYGCSSEERWDRYCSDGSFDLYDYRSENERRQVDALHTSLQGQVRWGALQHDLALSLQRARMADRPSLAQAYNWVGIGSVYTLFTSNPDATAYDLNTRRDENTTELALQDRIGLDARNSLWLGLRHTRLDRSSERTDGSRAVRDTRSFNTPWLALTHQLQASTLAYASYGQGVETDVAPNRSRYTNAGEALPALRSRQLELGLKHESRALRWQATVFDITRPLSADAGSCDSDNSCTRVRDGNTRNQGLELAAGTSSGPWLLDVAATWLQSRREEAWIDPGVNGQRSLNVPRQLLRAQAQYRWSLLPGLRTRLQLSHEGKRPVTEDGTLQLPSWTTLDAAAHYEHRVQGLNLRWTLAIDNLTDRSYWRESPKQFGHYYLYAGTPRTLRTSLNLAF